MPGFSQESQGFSARSPFLGFCAVARSSGAADTLETVSFQASVGQEDPISLLSLNFSEKNGPCLKRLPQPFSFFPVLEIEEPIRPLPAEAQPQRRGACRCAGLLPRRADGPAPLPLAWGSRAPTEGRGGAHEDRREIRSGS